MRITHLTLNDYNLVKDSGINKLSIDFTEDVQLIVGTNGSGKAQPLSAKVLTPKGWVPMREIEMGTTISILGGGTAKVVGIYPQGKKDIYRVTLSSGRYTECCLDHLWKVYSLYWSEQSRILPLSEIMKLEHDVMIPVTDNSNIWYKLQNIASISYVGKKEAQCIMIDHPDHLYITDNYILTHNTSVLRQISPTPQVKSLFGSNGFKSITVEKDGVEYRLESDYSKSTAPHSFFIEDSLENLNVGKTTQVQHELLSDYLNITPLVDDLIMNRCSFPGLTPSKRKEFLMDINPDKIGFILPLIKQTASKIRACKNNLSRLQSRKIVLEQDLLSPEVAKDLEVEKTKITEDLGFLQQCIMDTTVGLKTTIVDKDTLNFDITSVDKTLRSIRHRLHTLASVERDDTKRNSRKSKLLETIAILDHTLSSNTETILQFTDELRDLEIKYKEMSIDGDILEIESTISRLEQDIENNRIEKPDFELTQNELQIKYDELDEVINTLLVFENRSVPLYSNRKRQIRSRLLSKYTYELSDRENSLIELESRLEDINRRQTISIKDIPENPCSKELCPLYVLFFDEYTRITGDRDSLIEKIRITQRRIHKLRVYVTSCTEYFNESNLYSEKINWLIAKAQENPILHSVLRNIDILHMLSVYPNRIGILLKQKYDHISQWLKMKTIQGDLDTMYILKNKLTGSQSEDTVKLVLRINFLEKSLSELRNEIERISKDRKTYSTELRSIDELESFRTTVFTIKSNFDKYVENIANKHEVDKLNILLTGIEKIQSTMFIRLSEIERTLRSQTSLKERYEEEVVKQITKIETEMADLEQVEKALIAIPKEIIIRFINKIFHQANKLINVVWTVPFSINLLDTGDTLDYSFYVTGDNQSKREMSECSEGQTEILTLALNLAIRIILGHCNIPLCLDENGRTFDDTHKQNLVSLLKQLISEKIISQLFLVSHHAVIHDGFNNTETLVLREDNILLPERYNEHASIV